MKKILIAGASLLLTQFSFAQNRNEPPSTVRNAFQKEYPQSQPSRWNHSSTGWSVNFEDKDNNNGQATAHFDSRGRHVDTQVRYDNNDVPGAVAKTVRDRYPAAQGHQYTYIDRPTAPSLYKVNFQHKGTSHTMYLDEKGRETRYNGAHR